jgi:glycosyltransferase involved in cell wall biosynthesis
MQYIRVPRFSIITTYNSAKTIKQTIDSLLAQTFKNFEILIIDGLSTDDTIKIIKSYNDSRINVYSETDKGIYDALNKGIYRSIGGIIGFLHSDDTFYNDNVLSDIYNSFDSQIDGVYGDLNYVSADNQNIIIRNWVSDNFNPEMLKKGWMPPHPTLFLKNKVYEKHGNFKTEYSISSDYDFILRIFKDEELCFKYLNKKLVNMKIGGSSNKSLNKILIKLREDYKIIKSNGIGNLCTLISKNFTKISQFL